MKDAEGHRVSLSQDLKINLERIDNFEAEILQLIDSFIEQNGIDAPEEKLEILSDGYTAEEVNEINIESAGIKSIIWATGYNFDFNLVKLPVFDHLGYPVLKNGISRIKGLYFIGLPFISKYKSSHIIGVNEDADYITAAITGKN